MLMAFNDKRLPRRKLRPGAILGAVGSTALWALSLVILPSWFSWYGRGFGGIGIALAPLSWIYVISIVWVAISSSGCGVYGGVKLTMPTSAPAAIHVSAAAATPAAPVELL